MTLHEAIKAVKDLKDSIEWEYPMDYQIALDMAIEAMENKDVVEKQVSKQIELTGLGYWKYSCPSCGTFFTADTEMFDHCPDCGQAIDWREE